MSVRRWIVVALAAWLGACASFSPDAKQKTYVVVIDDPLSGSGMSGTMYADQQSDSPRVDVHELAMQIADDFALEVVGDWPLNQLGLYCFEIRAPSRRALDALERDSRVLWVQAAQGLALQSGASASSPTSLIDEFMETVPERGRNTVIAVIDTDVDESHPDLRNARLFVQDFVGDDRGMPMKERHGTAVVGLISAQPQSINGMRGIANEAEVHLLRACWEQQAGTGVCSTRTLSQALNAAIDLHPDVLNLSLSGVRDPLLDRLITVLVRNGTLVVAAYDETRAPAERFPAGAQGVLYAAGSTEPMSASGVVTVVMAPRSAISIAPMASYDVVSGHSIAAPIVSAMAACLIHRFPGASNAQITEQLQAWSERMWERRSKAAGLAH